MMHARRARLRLRLASLCFRFSHKQASWRLAMLFERKRSSRAAVARPPNTPATPIFVAQGLFS